jgi:hypothetical protein
MIHIRIKFGKNRPVVSKLLYLLFPLRNGEKMHFERLNMSINELKICFLQRNYHMKKQRNKVFNIVVTCIVLYATKFYNCANICMVISLSLFNKREIKIPNAQLYLQSTRYMYYKTIYKTIVRNIY